MNLEDLSAPACNMAHIGICIGVILTVKHIAPSTAHLLGGYQSVDMSIHAWIRSLLLLCLLSSAPAGGFATEENIAAYCPGIRAGVRKGLKTVLLRSLILIL